ncbi:hypothetical protein SMC26_28930 [Actinomadura fulvescens]|uniref:Uncharacterized protein n=1 Tax=Actinomadura fulvescens TaxID=46160 RepID=A0ABP6CC22_9ACTN
MTAVDIEIRPRRLDEDEIRIIEDVDDLLDADKCSCAAGDDQPY